MISVIKSTYIKYILFIVPVLFFSCKTTKYVPDDEYFLKKVKILNKDTDLNKDEVKSFIRQKPNDRFIGLRIKLGLYNLSNQEKQNWFNRTLRKIGEPPVLYDKYLTRKTKDQLELYLINQGYRNAEVNDTVIKNKQKAKIIYKIQANDPYLVDSIGYNIQDTSIQRFVFKDTSLSIVNPGIRFDLNLLEEERVRIENYLRTKGYFDFSKEYIYFMADTLEKQKKVDLTLGIKAYKKSVDSDNEIEPHPRYIIADIYVFTDYNKAKVLENRKLFFNSLDTLCYDSLYFLYHDEININPSILKQNIYISQNEWYNRKSVNETYMHLSSLNVLKLVDISFKTQQDTVYANDSIRYLDCYIQLTPSALQAYSIEIEGNNSSGDIGIAGNLTYQHRNFFNSAEVFDFKVRGAIEAVKERYKGKLDNTTEFGSEVRLRIPQFFLPWTRDNFVKRYNPRTNFVLSYNHQRRPDYTRRIINTSFGYNWMGFNYTSHRVNPFELNLVKLLESTDAFKLRINKNPYLKNSYEEHFILVSKYSFVFNNQKVSANKDFIYFRLNAESAGNLITGINDLLEMPKVNSRYQLFGNRYAQYIKGDFDIRYYHQLNDQDQIVFRVFAGAAYPYNNSNAVPFEKKYFAGGANSIRGWQVRSLGPGSYNEQVFTAFPNSLADIKLESNIEYRFDMFWIIKGALFIDAGNIWSIQPEDDRPGAVFKVDKFYKDIAVGSGFGTRFDLSFFIFRIDLGFKIHNPVKGHQKWIFSEKNIGPDDFNVNIGIGYPF